MHIQLEDGEADFSALSRGTLKPIRVAVPGAKWVYPAELKGLQHGDSALVYADLPADAALKIELSGGMTGSLSPKPEPAVKPLLHRAWVRALIERLLAGEGATDDEVKAQWRKEAIELSTTHRVLCGLTALLVLETEHDYVRYNIKRDALVDILTVTPEGAAVRRPRADLYGRKLVRAGPEPQKIAKKQEEQVRETYEIEVEEKEEPEPEPESGAPVAKAAPAPPRMEKPQNTATKQVEPEERKLNARKVVAKRTIEGAFMDKGGMASKLFAAGDGEGPGGGLKLEAGGGGGTIEKVKTGKRKRFKAFKRSKAATRVKQKKKESGGGRASVSGGALGGTGPNKAGVAKVIRRKNSSIRRCYEAALRCNPGLSGKVAVYFTVGTAGTIDAVRIAGVTGGLARCIAKKLQRIRGLPMLAVDENYSQSYVFTKSGGGGGGSRSYRSCSAEERSNPDEHVNWRRPNKVALAKQRREAERRRKKARELAEKKRKEAEAKRLREQAEAEEKARKIMLRIAIARPGAKTALDSDVQALLLAGGGGVFGVEQVGCAARSIPPKEGATAWLTVHLEVGDVGQVLAWIVQSDNKALKECVGKAFESGRTFPGEAKTVLFSRAYAFKRSGKPAKPALAKAPDPAALKKSRDRIFEARERKRIEAERRQHLARRVNEDRQVKNGARSSYGSPAGRRRDYDQKRAELRDQPAVRGHLADVHKTLLGGDTEGALELAWSKRNKDATDVIALVALGDAFMGDEDPAQAARAYGSLIDLFPSRADLRRYAGNLVERASGSGDPIAVDIYRVAVEQRPDHPSSHHMLAMGLAANGRWLEALDAASAGLHQQYRSGNFRGALRILEDDMAIIAAAALKADPALKKDVDKRLAPRGLEPDKTPSLRFVLTWETDTNDVDFHIFDGAFEHAYYQQKQLPKGSGWLFADVTTGYGPECFRIDNPKAYPYHLVAHYYRMGPMGYGMGRMQLLRHDGNGGLGFESRPYAIMANGAWFDMGRVNVKTAPIEPPRAATAAKVPEKKAETMPATAAAKVPPPPAKRPAPAKPKVLVPRSARTAPPGRGAPSRPGR